MALREKATLLMYFAMLPLGAFASDTPAPELEAALQSKYVNKVFTLHGLYDGAHLYFDRNGSPLGEVYQGSWTTSAIAIHKAKVSLKKIELHGSRIAEVYDTKKSRFVSLRTPESLSINVDRDATAPASVSLNALDRIFLGLNEHLSDIVPDYWKAIVSGAVEPVHKKDGTKCYRIKGRFSRKVGGGIAIDCTTDAAVQLAVPPTTINEVAEISLPYWVEKPIKPPRIVSDPSPEYWPLAKELAIEGNTTLELTVQADGSPSDIQIVEPVGVGLDDEAVAAVKKWRFKPATLNGQPVPVRIDVEVSFHLY